MKIQDIRNLIDIAYNTTFNIESIIDIGQHANFLNRRQNQELRNGDPNCVIKSIMDSDGTFKVIRAKCNYSQKQWMLILAGDELCLPIAAIKKQL